MRALRRPSSPLLARPALLVLAVVALPACARSRAIDSGADERGALLARAASAPGSNNSVGDVSTRHIQGAALSNDPMRPIADVISSYWRITARRDPRTVRPTVADQEVGVYTGSTYLGGWDYLRTVRSSEVVRVQRLTTSEAYFRYGRQHTNGAVVLTLQSGARR